MHISNVGTILACRIHIARPCRAETVACVPHTHQRKPAYYRQSALGRSGSSVQFCPPFVPEFWTAKQNDFNGLRVLSVLSRDSVKIALQVSLSQGTQILYLYILYRGTWYVFVRACGVTATGVVILSLCVPCVYSSPWTRDQRDRFTDPLDKRDKTPKCW